MGEFEKKRFSKEFSPKTEMHGYQEERDELEGWNRHIHTADSLPLF